MASIAKNNLNSPKQKMEVPARSSPPPLPKSPAGSRRVSSISTYDMTAKTSTSGSSPSIRDLQHQQMVKPSLSIDPLPLDPLLPNGRSEASFPVKLHQLLSSSDDRIIRWQPKNDGKSFTILNCEAFEAEVLPCLYRSANIEVFGQLLSLYGFQRVESGPYEGDYYHTLFIKDKPQLAHMIRKGGEAPPVSNPTTNPTAYASVPMESMALNHSLASSMHAQVSSRLAGLSFPSKLHYLLCHGVYDLGLEGIMRWQPGGHAFAIYSSESFEIEGLAQMLGTPGHASFRAQLSLHGFQRVRSDGPDVEAYYHADFVREQPQLCRLIRSRNHLKSNVIRRTPSTPTASMRRTIVSPMATHTPLSGMSLKSTISALPDSMFVDSPSLMLSPEPRGAGNGKAPPPPTPPAATTAMAIDVEGQDKKGGAKPRKRPRVGHMMPQNYFPFKLHSLLTLAEKFSLRNIMCWAPHGRCFVVNDKDLFCATVLPLFRHSEFASFRAQLKAYGFVRIGKSGPDKGAYYHTSFLRGKPELCATITRRPKNVNGTVRGRPKGRSYVEPDFYKLKFLPDLDVEQSVASSGNIKEVLEAALTQITPPAVVTREVATPQGVVTNADRATDGQAISITKNTSEVVAKLVKQNDPNDATLPVKLHALLNDAHVHSFNRMVRWNDSGRSFCITDEKVFDEILVDKWLNIPSLAAFQAELEMYGFKRRQNEPYKGSYYHEMFHKALPHLCRCIKKEEPKMPTCDSSVESQKVVVIDNASSPVGRSAPHDSSLSTISAGSATRKRTNSPELEVAMALTAMDDRSLGERAPMVAVDPLSPLPLSDARTVHLGGTKAKGLFVPELSDKPLEGTKNLLAPEMEAKSGPSAAASFSPQPAIKTVVSKPAITNKAISNKPVININKPVTDKPAATKRRSLDPDGDVSMVKKVSESAEKAIEAAKQPENSDNDVVMEDAKTGVKEQIDHTGAASETVVSPTQEPVKLPSLLTDTVTSVVTHKTDQSPGTVSESANQETIEKKGPSKLVKEVSIKGEQAKKENSCGEESATPLPIQQMAV